MSHSLLRFVAGRALAAAPILAGAVLVTFVIMRVLPGDPAALMASGPGSGPSEIAALKHQMGLDRPILEQLALYVRSIATGDLGRSFSTGNAVASDLAQRLPASLELTVAALFLSAAVGLPLGVGAALRPAPGSMGRAARLPRWEPRSPLSSPAWASSTSSISSSDGRRSRWAGSTAG